MPSGARVFGCPAGWSSDPVAGVTLAAYAIPVSLAYGLPPQVGLYGHLMSGGRKGIDHRGCT